MRSQAAKSWPGLRHKSRSSTRARRFRSLPTDKPSLKTEKGICMCAKQTRLPSPSLSLLPAEAATSFNCRTKITSALPSASCTSAASCASSSSDAEEKPTSFTESSPRSASLTLCGTRKCSSGPFKERPAKPLLWFLKDRLAQQVGKQKRHLTWSLLQTSDERRPWRVHENTVFHRQLGFESLPHDYVAGFKMLWEMMVGCGLPRTAASPTINKFTSG